MDTKNIEPLLLRFPHGRREDLIPLLQVVQAEHGYLCEDAMQRVGAHLKLPASKVYGVATFYNQFRFQPIGRHHVQICRGTACHVKGSLGLLETLEREMGIKPGQTTRDRMFSLEVVACLGACGLSPVLCVNGEFHARVTPNKVRRLIESLRKEPVTA